MDFDRQVFRTLSKGHSARSCIRIAQRPRVSNFYLKKKDKYEYVRYRLASMRPYFLELLGVESFEPVNHVSSTSFYTYGIVMNPFGHKLDPKNVFIASSIDGSNDVVVRLNLEYLQRYSVFPGQVVAIKGKNGTGSEITVEAIYCIPVVDVNSAEPSEKERHAQPFISAFSGPYGAGPEFGILDRILAEDADVLILTGPFIDPVEGGVSESPYSMMEGAFIPKIREWLSKGPERKVVLVPSTSDVISLNVFPQGPIDLNDERIICVSNPCSFFLNGFLVAVSSLDTALEISSEECFYDSKLDYGEDVCGKLLFGNDRLERISYHLVFQRTFLPVFPSMNIVSYSVPESMSMDTAPDIYIIVSRLKHFSRSVGPSVVVNLGLPTREAEKVVCFIRLPETLGEKKPSIEFRHLSGVLHKAENK
ncbi:DNA polymerase alpha subunit B [Encephalitozoon hellem ATCC 50504]|uniref:DNA polymerase alpha subunit B n=1 Tax=Encephalitozoon hellem TaxID=27973 RepID=A0A9Q9CC75_ENCHE|nr:DNA polymerase alpha subunit B [Encephalitozoon hellem ATCC 50504]AFM99202.1 DNA polymerase alpha subunit B [Encephalitozoon hellem ATCC 50504]UTX44188.1 DNA polymerase alpha subunit B [Encephalitozoon hellem]WEL39679.1 DNA polymerase alpha subunit B [Encephalitozoon hellem]|eukprot:XP_003888183.1 DNA polymerase alpha subunit B [Encephalitozoon hellem ATCC 50504]